MSSLYSMLSVFFAGLGTSGYPSAYNAAGRILTLEQ
jgi:hypothetical protein